MSLLDRSPFAATDPDAPRLLEALYQTFDDVDVAKSLAEDAGVDTAFAEFTKPIATVWAGLVRIAAKQGRLKDMVRLAAAHPNAAAAPVASLLARLLEESDEEEALGPEGNAPNPMAVVNQTVLIGTALPFINRVDLRNKLILMMAEDPQGALLVIGDSGSGKSYTRRFINFLAKRGGPWRVRPIDIASRAGALVDERELASLVTNALLGVEPPTFDPTAQPETVVTLFRAWLPRAVEEIEVSTWLVLDGFSERTATSGALQLVTELAQAAAMQDLGNVRVVVLGYSRNPLSAPLALCEPIRPPTRTDLKDFFRRAALTLQAVDPGDEAADAMVEELLSTGSIETRAIGELGPSAMALATTVFKGPDG